MAGKTEIDPVTGRSTTGHEWDGIRELNTPLPRWWLWIFYATIVFAVGYMVLMPAVPLVGDFTRGTLGYSSRQEAMDQVAATATGQQVYLDRIEASTLQQIQQDPELFAFAEAGGASAFGVNCAQCHGSGAAGSVGYPNLNDDDWLWGGTLDDIYHTIKVGIRSTDPDTRVNMMPAFLKDGILTGAQVGDAAEYVLALGGQPHDAAAAERGAVVFAEQCVACHQAGGVGSHELGAPSLVDGLWLYGGGKRAIATSIAYGRGGVMPSWNGKLSDATIKMLAVYVHALGGGE